MISFLQNLLNKLSLILRTVEYKKRDRLQQELLQSPALAETLWEIRHFVSTSHMHIRALQPERIFNYRKKFNGLCIYVNNSVDGIDFIATTSHANIRGEPEKVIGFVRKHNLTLYDKNYQEYLVEYRKIVSYIEQLAYYDESGE